VSVDPSVHIALFEPEIPHNVGAVARLCAATGTSLHLVGRLGFRLDDARVKRAGLDYWEHVEIHRHLDLEQFAEVHPRSTWFALSTKGRRLYTECSFNTDSALLFGSETRGLPPSVIESEQCFRIPMLTKVRSLNLATAAAIVLYEALRQQGFRGEEQGGGDVGHDR
jgi:tRNA (cytidine/uridine-2'-O-)-methyltransferase